MELKITQSEYCRFGGLKRFLLENGVDISDENEIQNLQLSKNDFSDQTSFLIDEELKELKESRSFWTQFDYDNHHSNNEYNFKVPVEKYNATFYSHYVVIKDWFSKADIIASQVKNKNYNIGSINLELFSNPVKIENSRYFELVRKICRTEEKFQNMEQSQFKTFFLYDEFSQLKHPVLLITSPAGIEFNIPFYGFYYYFKPDEFSILQSFYAYIIENFQTLLTEIELNHNSYLEEKYGEEFLKIKKHEMQYELKKQIEQELIRKFTEIVHELSSDLNCETQSNENTLKFIIYNDPKKQKLTFTFSFEELQKLLKNNLESVKLEIEKII